MHPVTSLIRNEICHTCGDALRRGYPTESGSRLGANLRAAHDPDSAKKEER